MPRKKKIGKKLKKFSLETRLKSSNKFKEKLLGLFKGYIKSIIVWGSISRGDFTGKSDVDIYIIFDDTKMPLKKFESIRKRIDKDIFKFAKETDPRLHPQPIIALTEFWDGIRTAHPLFYNIVREGYAIHDTGFFIPLRKLMEWGKLPATTEAAHIRMETVPKRIKRVQNVKLYMIAEDLYYALTDSAQAILMYLGLGPPAPKILARELRKHVVEAGLLEEKYAKMLEDVFKFRKKVEHKEVKEISGKEVDQWIKKADDYVKRMEKLLNDLEKKKKETDIKKSYEIMLKTSVAALKSIDKLPKKPEKLPAAFKKYLVEAGLISPLYGDVFGKVVEMRKLLEDKKIDKVPDRDVYMNKEYVRRFVMDVRRLMERGMEIPKELQKEIKVGKKMKKAKEEIKTAKEVKKLSTKKRKRKKK
jgi:uncharacterized protein (UPF0332 family)/predicted nucleotidyltransferase